jgi:hypothetical protein
MRARDRQILREYADRVPIAIIARRRRLHRRTVYKILSRYFDHAGG